MEVQWKEAKFSNGSIVHYEAVITGLGHSGTRVIVTAVNYDDVPQVLLSVFGRPAQFADETRDDTDTEQGDRFVQVFSRLLVEARKICLLERAGHKRIDLHPRGEADAGSA